MRKTVLITGASTGIGAATARMAAQRGWDVAINYNASHDAAQEVAQACKDHGAKALLCPGNVAEPDDIAKIYAKVDAGFGRLDALVNNAGIVDLSTKVTDLSHDRLRRMFDINVIGAILVAKEAVIRMQTQGDGGVIVNISSAAARLGSANQYVDYAASKAAIDTFTKGLSDEVAAQGIRVCSVRPGLIDTDIHAKGGEADRAQRLAHNVPMQRTGSAEEVAKGILYLMSDEASYVTGTVLEVTGGR